MLPKQREGRKVYNLRPTISAGRTQHPFRYYLYCYNIWAEMRKNNSLETIEQELDKLKRKITDK